MTQMPQEGPPSLLRIQTVLYRTELAQLWRLLHGLSAAAQLALDAGLIDRIEWAIGDCSPYPAVSDGDARAMLEASSDAISDVSYDFFRENLGSSGGQNRLANGHPSDLLLVLNPDTYPSPTALVELIKALAEPGVGIAEPRQLPLEHPRTYDRVTGDTSWASGFCMLVKRHLFDRLEGFDHDHFLLHCDDVDFSWRARDEGYRVVVAPYASVFHDKRPRPDAAWPAPEVEMYHAALGRLMLATRWNRPDIVDETIRTIDSHGGDVQRRALSEFRARAESGRLPAPRPDAHVVAQFIDGEYAHHRF